MDDLRCYLVDAPVMANPGTALTRLGKFAKRNKLLISASSLAIAGLLMGLVFSIIQERRAIVSEQQAKRQAYASDMLLTSMAIARGNYLLPQEILARHRDGSLGMVAGVTHSSEQRLDWRLLAAQLPQEPELLARFPTKIYFGMDLPHRNEIACGCKDSHLRILDRTSGSVRLDINTQQGEINGLALSPDGSEIACGGDDGTVRFYDIDTGNAKRQVKVSETSVFQIAWTQNGGHFVTVGNEANAKVWRLPDFQLATTLDSVNESLECLGVSRQGKVAFGSDKGVIRIASFDSELPTKMQTVSAVMSRVFQSNRCSTVVFSPSGRLLAVGLDNGYLLLMKDTGAAYQIVERVRFPTTVTAIAFNSDESTIALGENNGSAHLLDLPSDWPTQSRLRFTKYFFDQNSTFLSESERHPEQLWNTVARTEPANLKDSIPIDTDYVYMEFNKPLTNVIFPDNYIREWSDASGQTRPGWSEMPKSVIYKNDGIELRFENRHGSWSDFKSLESLGRLTSWSCHPKRIASIVWNERENSIQTFSEDGTVKNIASDRNRIRPVGGQNIHGILPLQRDLLALITSDYEPQFMRLDPDQEERSHLESLLQDQEAGKGLIVREARFLYFFRREPTDKSSVPRSIYQLDVESRLVKPVAQLPAVVSPEYLVGAFGENRLVLVYKENSGVDPDDSPRYGFLCWDTMLNQLVWKQKSTTETPRLPTSSPQGSYVTYIKEQGKYEVCLIDTDRGEERNLEDFVDVPILNVCFSKNDRFLAVSLSDNSIVCFRTDTGSRVWMIKAPGSPVNDMVWSDDGVTLACVSQDGFLRTFDTELRLMTAEILLPSISPVRIRLSPAEDWLYILNREGSLIRIQSGTKSLPRGPK